MPPHSNSSCAPRVRIRICLRAPKRTATQTKIGSDNPRRVDHVRKVAKVLQRKTSKKQKQQKVRSGQELHLLWCELCNRRHVNLCLQITIGTTKISEICLIQEELPRQQTHSQLGGRDTEPNMLLSNGCIPHINPPPTREPPHPAQDAHSPTCSVPAHAMQMQACTLEVDLRFVVVYFPTANLAVRTRGKSKQATTNAPRTPGEKKRNSNIG